MSIFFNRWVFVLALAFSETAVAGETGPSITAAEKNGRETQSGQPDWTGDFGINFVSAYFAFGILQENQGAIAEPYFDASRTLFTGEGWFNKATLGLQLWSSMHSADTGAANGNVVPWWYEFDYYVPFGLTIANEWTVTVSYLDYEFPNGAFAAQRGIQCNVAYDDSKVMGAFALRPHALVLYNFDGVLGLGQSKAWYYEFGVAPSLSILAKSKCSITVTFPLTVGCGDNHFYPGGGYGYFSVASNASVSLAFLAKAARGWTANAGFTYYNLGESTASINSNRGRNACVWQIGLGKNF